MKKLMTILAIAMATSFAMAQNSAVVSSTGNYNDASITQGIANNNDASILQIQNGDKDYHAQATIDQVASSWAKITQYNTRNYATINEALNDKAEIYQDGQVNNSTISFGWGQGSNVGYTEQIGTYNLAVTATTGHNNGIVGDPLSIIQHGNNNTANLESGWNAPASNYDIASIVQNGDNNNSKIRQEGGDWNVARVSQNGNNDVANLLQHGGNLVATITQTGGNKNIVNLDQTGGVATIYQNGNSNKVEGLNNPVVPATDPVTYVQDPLAIFAGSTLNVTQLQDNNTLDLKSTSPFATVSVYQNGMSNNSFVIQK